MMVMMMEGVETGGGGCNMGRKVKQMEGTMTTTTKERRKTM